MERLPAFFLDGYRSLLAALKQRGAEFHLISELPRLTAASGVVCLRHDIDCHPAAALEMAELEAGEGVASTWYVLLTAHYNPRSRVCRSALQRLTGLGHEIGLHYDLSTYPDAPEAAAARLRAEANDLADITGAPVTTISCHQPHKGLPDSFRTGSGFVHCHDPGLTGDLLYVSDSCRAWRDDSLLRWLHGSADPSSRGLQLLTHPELWCAGEISDRMRYCDEVLLPLMAAEVMEAAAAEIREVWRTHEGARRHDEREQGAGTAAY